MGKSHPIELDNDRGRQIQDRHSPPSAVVHSHRKYSLCHVVSTVCIPLQDGFHKPLLRRACVLEWSESQILQECYCAFWEGNPPLLYVVTF